MILYNQLTVFKAARSRSASVSAVPLLIIDIAYCAVHCEFPVRGAVVQFEAHAVGAPARASTPWRANRGMLWVPVMLMAGFLNLMGLKEIPKT